MNRKSIFVSTTLLLLTLSCSSNDNDDTTNTNNQKNDLSIKIDFVGSSTASDLTNVQVGDTLTFKYKIASNFTAPYYYITPQTSDVSKHQKINDDFELYFDKTKYSEITTSKKEGEFKMYIKRPGNFQNKFSIKSIKDNTTDAVGTNDGEILFNAVKINAYSYTRKTRDDGTFHHSEWNYYNKLYIDTGNQESDNYLNNVPFSAKFSFIENVFQGLKQKLSFDFYDMQHYKGGSSAAVQPTKIDVLTFKKLINNQIVTVEYKNIPVVYQSQQDTWGDDGKNNW